MEEEQTSISQTVPPMDEETRQRVLDYVIKVGKERARIWGKEFSDADFATGALAAMEAMGLSPLKFPASFTLGIALTDRSPFRDQKK
jgi:hypothetical protein